MIGWAREEGHAITHLRRWSVVLLHEFPIGFQGLGVHILIGVSSGVGSNTGRIVTRKFRVRLVVLQTKTMYVNLVRSIYPANNIVKDAITGIARMRGLERPSW